MPRSLSHSGSSSSTAPCLGPLLLPSERERVRLSSSLPSSPSSTPAQSKLSTKSRNDLFTLDWSPITPNLAKGPLPPPSLAPLAIPPRPPPREQPQLVLPPTPPFDSHFLHPPSSSSPKSRSYAQPPPRPPPPPTRPREPPVDEEAGSSSMPILDTRQSSRLRLSPTKEYHLGEGRHASVYLASYIPPSSSSDPPSSTPWTLCAAKLIHPDRESQLAGLGEAFVLSRLAPPTSSPCPPGAAHILRLYGVKDERDGIEPVDLSRRPSSSSSLSEGYSRRRASFQSRVELVPPLGSPSIENQDLPLELGVEDPQLVRVRKGPRHSEPGSGRKEVKREEGRSAGEKRMVLMLEYCPFGHVLGFLRKFPERVGRRRWVQWAKELASAVVWMHDKGILHGDLKPHNVLVCSDLSLRLSDFGMSMFLPPPSSTSPLPTDPLGLGSPAYSPPEFVQPPPSPFSFPSDIFSLGVLLSVLLSAHEPYEGLRAVERMFLVARGGYWEWEERRRLCSVGEVEQWEVDGWTSGPVSRAGSIRSTRSGRSRVSEGGGGRRSESVESRSSAFRESGEWGGAWNAAMRIGKLLWDEEGEEERPTTPASASQMLFSLPPAGEEQEEQEEEENEREEERETSYRDGTPVQYFMSGEEVVPLEVRELIRAMTSPKAEERPTAVEVLQVLETL